MIIIFFAVALMHSAIADIQGNNKTSREFDADRSRLMNDVIYGRLGLTQIPVGDNKLLKLNWKIDIHNYKFNEAENRLNLMGTFSITWHDHRIIWNPMNYNNISHIIIDPEYVWLPDLEIYENLPTEMFLSHRNGYIAVASNGSAKWSNIISIKIICTSHIKYWPNVKYKCAMILGSWGYDGLSLDFYQTRLNKTIDFSTINMRYMPYKLVNVSVNHKEIIYQCCPEPYVSIEYMLDFQRQTTFPDISTVPAVCVIIFTLLGFLLKPNRIEKLWLNMMSFTLAAWQPFYLMQCIKCITDEPNISKFFSNTLIMITIAQLVAIFSLAVTQPTTKLAVPYYMELLLKHQWLSRLLPSFKESSKIIHAQELQSVDQSSLDAQLISSKVSSKIWTLYAIFVQSLFFIFYAILFFILWIFYMV